MTMYNVYCITIQYTIVEQNWLECEILDTCDVYNSIIGFLDGW